ncbi:hypothetical protein B0T10DRAFT_557892 [Thelonectria olida]|uniref:RING-type domain-containing protein n=1 Tax=Thelonectria olida TaxID=1576542 RepID=A0A9P8WAQ8_9HYPO|nr:hypothetical protein B0T10DRAFT_557892 [Thelonectria olida]
MSVPTPSSGFSSPAPSEAGSGTSSESKDSCFQAVTDLFPNICPEYLESIAAPLNYVDAAVIHYIVDLAENGGSYRRSKLKRKRDEDADHEALISKLKRQYLDSPKRREDGLWSFVSKLLANEFPNVRIQTVRDVIKENGDNLAPAYMQLWKLGQMDDKDSSREWKKKKRTSPLYAQYFPSNIMDTIKNCPLPWMKTLLEELCAARLLAKSWDGEMAAAKEAEAAKKAEEKNTKEAIARGDVADCECCYAETPTNRLVHCNGDKPHLFCYGCARRTAETAVGLSKYRLTCMSIEGCEAGFSRDQRAKFIDEKLEKAMDRIEKDTNLRTAGIKNLVSCPFCDYTAECHPVEIDKEFRCQNPECKTVSCRLCQKETHTPLSCAEANRDDGGSARHRIEEAMTAALLRNCNNCGAPFIKSDGCNKMKCPQCRHEQCYVCSKPCDYSHFNDPSKGGKAGNCPLFDKSTEARHEQEVKAAQVAEKKKMVEKFPHVNPEDLDIKMSEKVAHDDQQRRQAGMFHRRNFRGFLANQDWVRQQEDVARIRAQQGQIGQAELAQQAQQAQQAQPPRQLQQVQQIQLVHQAPQVQRAPQAHPFQQLRGLPQARPAQNQQYQGQNPQLREEARAQQNNGNLPYDVAALGVAQVPLELCAAPRAQPFAAHNIPHRHGMLYGGDMGMLGGVQQQRQQGQRLPQNAAQPNQPQNAPQRHWLRELQNIGDLGFGPMQGLDFGRAIGNNNQQRL